MISVPYTCTECYKKTVFNIVSFHQNTQKKVLVINTQTTTEYMKRHCSKKRQVSFSEFSLLTFCAREFSIIEVLGINRSLGITGEMSAETRFMAVINNHCNSLRKKG